MVNQTTLLEVFDENYYIEMLITLASSLLIWALTYISCLIVNKRFILILLFAISSALIMTSNYSEYIGTFARALIFMTAQLSLLNTIEALFTSVRVLGTGIALAFLTISISLYKYISTHTLLYDSIASAMGLPAILGVFLLKSSELHDFIPELSSYALLDNSKPQSSMNVKPGKRNPGPKFKHLQEDMGDN